MKDGDRLIQTLPAFIRKINGIEKGLAIVHEPVYILDDDSTQFVLRAMEIGSKVSKCKATEIMKKVIRSSNKEEQRIKQIRLTKSIR